MARDPVSRLREVVLAAKELGFEIVVKSPFTEPDEFRRVAPPLKPDTEGHLVFYVGEKLWKEFLFYAERYPNQMAALADLGDVYYKPPKRQDNGTESSG